MIIEKNKNEQQQYKQHKNEYNYIPYQCKKP